MDLTELANEASPSLDDLLYLVNDPAGVPGDRMITIADLGAALGAVLDGAYVQLVGDQEIEGRVGIAPTDEPTIAGGTSFTGRNACTFQIAGNTVTDVAHGLVNGTQVGFSSIVGTTGITAATSYFVVNKTNDTFQVSLTNGGAAIDLTGIDGTGYWGLDDVVMAPPAISARDEEQFYVDLPGGRISLLYSDTLGIRGRINKTMPGVTAGWRYQIDSSNLWDIDIDTSGKFFLDDVSVHPSQPALTAELGQPSTGINIGGTIVTLQRMLDLVDLATGALGVRMHYNTTNGFRIYDATLAGPPAIVTLTMGAAGKLLLTPGTGGVEISGDGVGEQCITLTNTNPNPDKSWRLGAIQEGVSHSHFTIRDTTLSRDVIQIDGVEPIAEDTCLLIRCNDAGVMKMQRVSMGANDSGGAGFKCLRVPN